MATFKKVFKDVYEDGLKSEGFRYNSKYDYFFRIINNELIQYITHISVPSLEKGTKRFDIFAGTVSVYSESVDKDFLRMAGRGLYAYTKYRENKVMVYTSENMVEVVEVAYNKTMNIVMPILNEVVDLNTYINFRKKTEGLIEIGSADKFWADSLALIVADNHDDFEEYFQGELKFIEELFRIGKTGGTYESRYNSLHEAVFGTVVGARDKVYQDKQLYAEAIAEAERRKMANLEYLRSMKVIE